MRVRDVVTGVDGIVTGYHSWISGCDTVTLQPKEFKDGKPVDSFSRTPGTVSFTGRR
jgi:hypothetical protein